MFALRVYVAALDLALLVALLASGRAGAAELLFVALPPLYMILEMRQELRELESAGRRLKRLGPG